MVVYLQDYGFELFLLLFYLIVFVYLLSVMNFVDSKMKLEFIVHHLKLSNAASIFLPLF